MRTRDRAGLAVAVEDDLVVAIDTALTPELIREGQAREIVHRIQTLRKNADYQIEEKIVTYYEGGPGSSASWPTSAITSRRRRSRASCAAGVPAAVGRGEEFKLDGEPARLAVARA